MKKLKEEGSNEEAQEGGSLVDTFSLGEPKIRKMEKNIVKHQQNGMGNNEEA